MNLVVVGRVCVWGGGGCQWGSGNVVAFNMAVDEVVGGGCLYVLRGSDGTVGCGGSCQEVGSVVVLGVCEGLHSVLGG